MDTSLDNHSQDPDAILKLIKDAIWRCRESSSQLSGFARGLEIGISTLQGSQSYAYAAINCLRERSVRLSASPDDYHLGVVFGINLTLDVASAMFGRARATV
jgi:hypothetical protein